MSDSNKLPPEDTRADDIDTFIDELEGMLRDLSEGALTVEATRGARALIDAWKAGAVSIGRVLL